jgi:RNA ligase
MFGNNGFPIIRHIDDVLPHVEGRTDFAIKRRDGYTAIDYIFAGPDTFDHPIRRECRGIKFGADGKIIARPYHKFFNVGEKPETRSDVIDWTASHVVLEKLDGSMVHPAMVEGQLLWMTRAGVTYISEDAGRHAIRTEIADQAMMILRAGLTPIFEWCSPRNQIVVRYPSDRLILTAVRSMETGAYVGIEDFTFDTVNVYGGSIKDLTAFMTHVRDLKDAEGYVVRWSSGAMVKVKADDYVTRHKARDSILLEKNVLRIVLEGATDDVIPLLAPEDAERLKRYDAGVTVALANGAEGVCETVASAKAVMGDDRKRFAIGVVASVRAFWKAPLFAVWSGADHIEAVRSAMLKHCGSQTDVDQLRNIMSLPHWQTQSIQEAA